MTNVGLTEVVVRERPARWPWAILALFVAAAVIGTIGVAINGESVAEQLPYVVAFTLFGVVGALLLSRIPGNRIGALLLYGAATVSISYVAGEIVTYLFRRGHVDGALVIGLALL